MDLSEEFSKSVVEAWEKNPELAEQTASAHDFYSNVVFELSERLDVKPKPVAESPTLPANVSTGVSSAPPPVKPKRRRSPSRRRRSPSPRRRRSPSPRRHRSPSPRRRCSPSASKGRDQAKGYRENRFNLSSPEPRRRRLTAPSIESRLTWAEPASSQNPWRRTIDQLFATPKGSAEKVVNPRAGQTPKNTPQLNTPKRYASLLVGNATRTYFFEKGLANPTFIEASSATEALVEMRKIVSGPMFGLGVLAFDDPVCFDKETSSAMQELSRLAHVAKILGPREMDTAGLDGPFIDIELTTPQQIGKLLAKEAEIAGYRVTKSTML